MTEEREQEFSGLFESSSERDHPFTAKGIAFAAWVVTAGAYGYGAALFEYAEHPEHAWLFLLLGLGIGVGISASIIAAKKTESEKK